MRAGLGLLIALMAWGAVARADCVGQNLIAALPEAERAALQVRANAVPFPVGNLWTATKAGQTVTLVGTFHLDDPRHTATLDLVAPSLATATALLVEAGPDEEQALKSHVASHPERLINTTGPTLPEALPPADWQRLTQALAARDIPAFFAAKMQPWYLTSILAIPACQFNQAAAVQGLDHRLMDRAEAQGLPVQALEPYDTIFTIFDSFAPADQLAMLTQTVDAAALEDDLAVTLADSYFAGENRLFWEFSRLQLITLSGLTEAEADRETALMEEAMINRRNRAWVPVIEAAAEKGRVLVAFGALHLPGEDGVLNLLAQRGWAVVPLTP